MPDRHVLRPTSTMDQVRALSVMLALAGLAAGCGAPITHRAIETVVPSRPAAPGGRTAFSASLRATTRAALPAGLGRPTATLELRFRDAEQFEYRLTLRDAVDGSYAKAAICRSGSSVPLAVLVDGLEISGVYVQLRGTGTVPETPDGSSLLDELRRAPGALEVQLRPSVEGPSVLVGVIR